MKKHTKPLFYYSILGCIVLVQTFTTLFHSAVGLTQHVRYNALEKEKQSLSQEIGRLRNQVASQISVLSVEQSPLRADFIPISSVLTVKDSDTLAAIQ